MHSFDQIDAVLGKHGWTFDRLDEVFRDPDGQMIDPENVLAVMPPDIDMDLLATYADCHRAPFGAD
jgi:hypothetical protein